MKMYKIWNVGKIVGLVLMLAVSIGLVEKNYRSRTCTAINVNISNQYQNYFINESDVIDLLTDGGDRQIVGAAFEDLDLKQLESSLLDTKFVHNAEVFKNLEGTLTINIDQSRPIARLMSKKLNDRYISSDGKVLPLSKRYTARVVLIDGTFADNASLYDLTEKAMDRQLMDLLYFIDSDPFWKAQIAQLNIDKKGNIKMHTQVSKQVVEFGKPENIENKFNRLKIFYKDILPAKGWNSYKRVSVKFNDQIVCE